MYFFLTNEILGWWIDGAMYQWCAVLASTIEFTVSNTTTGVQSQPAPAAHERQRRNLHGG